MRTINNRLLRTSLLSFLRRQESIVVLFILMVFMPGTHTFSQSSNVFPRWDATDKLIRDRKIEKDAAIDFIKLYVSIAVQESKQESFPLTKRKDWKYPLAGFTSVTYRNNGDDYKDGDYDYFQGGEFKGHPAHDIFILDKDSNGIEDVTGEKVKATAMVSGVIISTQTGWKREDFLRSGNYVKLFDPESRALFYYSHLDSIFVSVGQFVNAGDEIGSVGRTGRKAIHGRTHLHIAYYKINDGYPEPEDIIEELYRISPSHPK